MEFTARKSETKPELKEVATAKKEPESKLAPRALSPFADFDRIFESFFPRGYLSPLRYEWPKWNELGAPIEAALPRVDVIERDDAIVVKAELPGIEKDNIEISLTEDSVTIQGETTKEVKEEKGNYYRSEISRGSFARTVALPNEINTDKAKATFTNGLLEVTLPKLEKTKRRTVAVE